MGLLNPKKKARINLIRSQSPGIWPIQIARARTSGRKGEKRHAQFENKRAIKTRAVARLSNGGGISSGARGFSIKRCKFRPRPADAPNALSRRTTRPS